MNKKLDTLKESPIIAVLRGIRPEEAPYIVEALLSGGINNIELTYGKINPNSIIREIKDRFTNDIHIGAGTVLTVEQAVSSIESGAEFIFSPIMNKDVIEETVRRNKLSIPGCYTATEMYEATKAGAQCVKLFPATSLGPNFIKDVKAPMPFLNIIPTGGINEGNISEYLKAGATAVGLGSSLVSKEILKDRDYEKLRKKAKQLTDICNNITN